MEHVAIMSRSLKLIDKIVSGTKTIESRWYQGKKPPWDSVSEGDAVYFKESGGPVKAQAIVEEVMQFPGLTPVKVREILGAYGGSLGVDVDTFYDSVKDKTHCILLRLRDAHPCYPFQIDKKGFGVMSAWMSVESVKALRKPLKQ